MRGDHVKLLREEAAQAPQTAVMSVFPSTRYQITADGLLISHLLGPGLTIHSGIGEPDMNEICTAWQASREQKAHEAELIRKIEKSKLP